MITESLLRRHPAVDLEIRSLSSIEIGFQLDAHAIDAGITYLDNEPLGSVTVEHVYDERYVFLSADGDESAEIAWAELDGRSLCLLSPEMQNRRIGVSEGMHARALVAPDVAHVIGLVTPKTDLVQPVVRALLDELGKADLSATQL